MLANIKAYSGNNDPIKTGRFILALIKASTGSQGELKDIKKNISSSGTNGQVASSEIVNDAIIICKEQSYANITSRDIAGKYNDSSQPDVKEAYKDYIDVINAY